jgi:hypothetical protein
MGGRILYPAPDGIAQITLNGADLATLDLFDRRTWNSYYRPAYISAYQAEGWYIGFYSLSGGTQAGFMFNPVTKEFIDLDLYATAGFNDAEEGLLYLLIDGAIMRWDGGSTFLEIDYWTRIERAPYPVCMCVGQVIAQSYPVTFKVYDGQDNLIASETVIDGDPFFFAGGYLADEYSVRVKSSVGDIIWFGIADSMDAIREALNSGGI